jgi:hypothetical protein
MPCICTSAIGQGTSRRRTHWSAVFGLTAAQGSRQIYPHSHTRHMDQGLLLRRKAGRVADHNIIRDCRDWIAEMHG